MAELPYQTYERVTGKKWTGGASPEVTALLKQAGITAQPGSAEANIALQKYLTSTTPQQTAPQAVNIPAPAAPTGVSATLAAAEAEYKALQEEIARKEQETAAKRAQTEAERQTWIQRLEKEPIPEAQKIMEEEGEKWYIPEYREMLYRGVAKMEAALSQVNELQAAMNQALSQSEQRLAPTVFIRGEQALIQERYGLQIANATAVANAEAVKMEAIRGNIETARGFINDMVNAATWEYEQRVGRIKDFININSTIISELSADERALLDNKLDMAQKQLEWAKAEKALIGELMVTYPDANISPNMTIDQAYQAAQRASKAMQEEERRRWEAEYAISLESLRLQQEAAAGKQYSNDDITTWAELVLNNDGDIGIVPEDIATKVSRRVNELINDPNWVATQASKGRAIGESDELIRAGLKKIKVPSKLIDQALAQKAPEQKKQVGVIPAAEQLAKDVPSLFQKADKAIDRFFWGENTPPEWWRTLFDYPKLPPFKF